MESVTHENRTKREAGPDFIRISACILVILMHTSSIMFFKFSENWSICVAYNALTRSAVPLFFMLSGYFLLNKRIESIPLFYITRLHRILFPFFIVLIIYYIKLCVFQNEMSSHDFIVKSLTGKIPRGHHFWFIYTLVGVYITLPFFSYFFNTPQGMRFIKVYLVIWCISCVCFPIFEKLHWVSFNIFKSFRFDFFSEYTGYLLLGGVISRIKCKNTSSLAWFGLYIFASFLIFISTYLYSHYIQKPSAIFIYENPLVLMQSVGFFLAFMDLNYSNKVTGKFAELSYWIYLIHILLLDQIKKIIDVTGYSLFSIPFTAFFVISLAFVLSFPLRHFENICNRLFFTPCFNKLKTTLCRLE